MFEFGETMDKINMSKADFEIKLNGFMAMVHLSELDTQVKSEKLTNYVGVIPGKDPFTLSVNDTGKGLTITYKTGKNHRLGFDVANSLVAGVGQVAPKTQIFVGITQSMFDSFKKFVQENQYNIETPKVPGGDAIKIMLKNGINVTITYYPTGKDKKVKLEGRKTYLWNIVALWFAEQSYGSINDILTLIYNESSVKDARLVFDDVVLDRLITKDAGEVYSDPKVINLTEKKWLRTGCMLCNMGLELPEYLPVVSSSIKVVEGLLWKIIVQTCGQDSFDGEKAFIQFSGEKLTSRYINKVGCEKTVDYINSLYAFHKNSRHKYFHNDGVMSQNSCVVTLDDAKKIYKEILKFVNKANGFKEKFYATS